MKTKVKRGKQANYELLFIKQSGETARLGKTVYVRREFHDRIQKIVQVVGNNEVSIFSYIDNVLEKHFEDYMEDISLSYSRKNNSKLF